MKAILIIDMPQNCVDCPCSFTFGSPPHNICEAMNDKSLTKENMNNTKPSWCPLKPMPERKKVGEIERVGDFMKSEIRVIAEKVEAQIRLDTELLLATGYNSCLDEILGANE